MQTIEALYNEVTAFFVKAGGSYLSAGEETWEDILQAIIDNRIILKRNEAGELLSATTLWYLISEDILSASRGQYVADKNTGSIVYIADHAGTGVYRQLIKFLIDMGFDTACWHHRYKTEEAFRIYRRPSCCS